MAVLLYSNGITEDYVPQSFTFSERELVNLFNDFALIRTKRLISVLNCWCIWGENKQYDVMEFNRIVSDITQEAVYSPALFVHDSEINPEWKATDTILYQNYSEFLIDIKKFIDQTATDIVEQFQNYEDEDGSKKMPVLETIGPTKDKRILFAFNPEKQYEEFYAHEQFILFSKKAFEYLKAHVQDEEPFTIFADKKAIIIVDTKNVPIFINKMLEKFKDQEQYEICNELTSIMNKWTESLSHKQKKPSTEI